jgi:iron complex outermembrane receptor protein
MMIIRNRPWSAACARATLICVSATWAGTGWCQSTNGANDATPAENGAIELQEVVVTALRRDTDLQKTPVSVAAVSAATLSQTGALDFIDFAASVPGFTILDNGPAERRPIIRGIEGAGEGEVGIYYDEFPISSTPGATNDAGRFTPDIKLIDVQQVQVLRGPQGTLFGAGSEGGTIQTIFNTPDLGKYSGTVATDVGSISHGTENVLVNGTVNVPLIQDTLGMRLVGFQVDNGGYVDNTVLDVNDINSGRTYGGRAAIRYQPLSNLTVDLLALYNQASYDAGNETIASAGPLRSNVPAYDPLQDAVHLYGFTAKYTLGFATLTADASSYLRDLFFNFTFPGLGIPWTYSVPQGLAPFAAGDPTVGNANVQQPQNTKASTYELRLNAADAAAALQWTLGGFVQNRDAYARSYIPFVGGNGKPDLAFPLFQDRTILSSLDQRAAYGEVSYDFFQKLTATAGARWETFSATQATAYRINTGGSLGTNAYTERDFSASKVIKKGNLAYQLTNDFMAYLTYSEGFRAGGANQAVFNEPTLPYGYGSDTVRNYEGGIKSQWLDKFLTVNADYYRMDWENIQVQGSTPDGLYRFTTNAGQARIDGVELEAHAHPLSGLDLGLTYGNTIARLTRNEPANPGLTESGFAGDRLPNVPAQSANLSADYTMPLVNALALRFYANYQFVGKSQNLFSPYLANAATGAQTATPDPGFAYMPAYSVVDLRISLQTDRWTASVYSNNVGDRRGITNVLWDSPFTPGRYTYYITPRVVGVSASVKLL